MDILNLDKLVPDDKQVKLNGKDWKLPGETSVKVMLEILKNAKVLESNPQDVEANEAAFKTMHELFIIKQPDLTFEDFQKMLTVNQYIALVNFIYSDQASTEVSQKKITD